MLQKVRHLNEKTMKLTEVISDLVHVNSFQWDERVFQHPPEIIDLLWLV